MTRGLRALAVATMLVAAPVWAAPPVFNKRTGLQEVPFSQLEAAVARGDRAETSRTAERIGPARIAAALSGKGPSEPKTLLAVLEAVPSLSGNLRLVDRLAFLMEASRDPNVAERAAEVLGVVFATQSPGELDTWDVPADAITGACLALSRVGTGPANPVPLRLAAVEALAEARSFCSPLASLTSLFADPSAELRRAALLLGLDRLPNDGAVDVAARLHDPVPWVAATAGAVICNRRQPLRQSGAALGKQPLPTQYRSLVFGDGTWIEDALDLLPCLYRSNDPADRRAFDELRNGKPGPLRERAREIAEQDKARPQGG